MHAVGIINNAALLLVLGLVYALTTNRWRGASRLGQAVTGALFGLIALGVMATPMRLMPGVVFDSRSVVVSLAGLFGGPLAALLAAVPAMIFRYVSGGAGALTGMLVIAVAAVGGVLYRWRLVRRHARPSYTGLYGFGVLVHLGMLCCMLTMPRQLVWPVLSAISVPVMAVFPVATLLLGMLLLAVEAKISSEHSLRRYHEVFQNAGFGIAVSSADGQRFEMVNPAYARMHGLSPQQLEGQPIADTYLAEDRPALLHDLALADSLGHHAFEVRKLRHGGGVFPALLDATSVHDAEGRFLYRLVYAQDISTRKAAEKALADSEQLFRHAFENAHTGVCLISPSGLMLKVNRRMVQMFGYDESELVGHSVEMLTHPDSARVSPRFIEDSLAGVKDSGVFEKKYLHKNGQMIWGRVSSSLIRDPSGHPKFFISHVNDITQSKLAETALAESEQRFRGIFEQVPVGLDLQGEILRVNPYFARFLGRAPEQLLGVNLGDAGHPADKAHDDERMALLLAGEIPFHTADKRFIRADGQELWGHVTVTVNSDADGAPAYLGVVVEDITARRKLEQQLAQARKLESIGTLAGGIAHDFNNILGSIIGYAELAVSDTDQEPVRQSLNQIVKAGLRARGLVKQILSFARQTESDMKPLRLGSLIREVAKLLRAAVPPGIEIKTTLEAEEDMVLADPGQIHQVLMNLGANAAQAMGATGVVGFELSRVSPEDIAPGRDGQPRPGRHLRLSVRDTGPGIKQENLQRIFDPFFTTKAPGEGTGLGLAVVHGIIANHNGFIRVYSEEGKGAAFHVYLPVMAEVAEPDAPVACQPRREPPRGVERILIVDDEADLAKLSQIALTRLGYQVAVQPNGDQALRQFQADPDGFDLVLTDQAMPGMSGLALAKAIKALRPETPVLLCTGFNHEINSGGFADPNIDGLLLKPLAMDELAQALRRALDRHKG